MKYEVTNREQHRGGGRGAPAISDHCICNGASSFFVRDALVPNPALQSNSSCDLVDDSVRIQSLFLKAQFVGGCHTTTTPWRPIVTRGKISLT